MSGLFWRAVRFEHDEVRNVARAAPTFEPVSRPQWITIQGVELPQGARAPVQHHYVYERMLARLPSGVRDTLTAQQLDCISDALIPDPPQHAVDYRVSIPFFGRRYYLTIFMGPERRSLERLTREAQLRARHVAVFYSILLIVLGCAAFLGFVMLGYLLKSTLGVDVLPGPSMLHPYFY